MTQKEKIKAVAQVLKSRFPNLTVEETIDLAFTIIEVIEGKA
jgi:hypothetical protein